MYVELAYPDEHISKFHNPSSLRGVRHKGVRASKVEIWVEKGEKDMDIYPQALYCGAPKCEVKIHDV